MVEKTSTGVSKVKEWKGSSVWYKINCACGGGECDSLITFDFDEDFGDIDICFYKTILWGDYYQTDKWISKLWLRMKMATQILFKGFTELEGSFIVQGRDHIDSIITALQEGKSKMEGYEKDLKND